MFLLTKLHILFPRKLILKLQVVWFLSLSWVRVSATANLRHGCSVIFPFSICCRTKFQLNPTPVELSCIADWHVVTSWICIWSFTISWYTSHSLALCCVSLFTVKLISHHKIWKCWRLINRSLFKTEFEWFQIHQPIILGRWYYSEIEGYEHRVLIVEMQPYSTLSCWWHIINVTK